MMDEDNIEYMINRLNWYIYDADYNEYNEQDVNFIIDFLKKTNPDEELELEKSVITLDLGEQTYTVINDNKKKIRIFNTKSLAILIAISTVIFSIFAFNNESIADINFKFMKVLYRDSHKEIILVLPSKDDDIINYALFSELPSELGETIWEPTLPGEYQLNQIIVNKVSDKITVKYKNHNSESGYFNMIYANQSLDEKENLTIINTEYYNNIEIVYYVKEENINMLSFNIGEKFYYMESDEFDILHDIVYDFIDFLDL